MAALTEAAIPIKAGDVSKRGGSSKDKKTLSMLSMNSMKKRYVALFANELRVSEGPGPSAAVKHVVPCHAFKVRIDLEDLQSFQVEFKDQLFEFSGDSDVETEVWVNALIDATLKSRNESDRPYKRHEYLLGTPHSAAYLGDYDALATMLKNSSNACALKLDANGYSPAYIACLKGHEDILSLLIEAGADILKVDSTTLDTLLHVTCEFGTLGQVRMLLNKKLDESALNKSNLTPLDVTILKRTHEPEVAASIIGCLCSAGSDASDSLKHVYGSKVVVASAAPVATLRMPTPILKSLLRHGAKPNLPHEITSSSSSDASSSTYSTALERIIARAAPGGLDVGGADLSLLTTLCAFGAHVQKHMKTLSGQLSPYALEEVEKSIEEWTSESAEAKIGTVVVNKKGWIPDKDSAVCLSCFSKFTATHRRHHCR
jgi:hypothetical protein